ncbi:GerMN domain-containing protein [Leptospira idonii]|uniref:Spore gernimation protein n=1 Tax=Leptospira idonii TaxID=1193500 RepID=A0A4R9LYW0_9LEPT|nr:GerMN domain-containing protein [Leptospira idonii]TGN18655.1 spore gernimation protein [Leptospira idonii]
MAISPPQSPDRLKSLSYVIGGLFFVLVLIEKSLGYSGNQFPKGFGTDSFKNISSHSQPQKKNSLFKSSDPLTSNEWEDDLSWEEEALEDPILIGEEKKRKTKVASADTEDGFSIPEISLPEDRFPSSGKKIQETSGYLPVYFLKFYGQGKNTQSQLVKVSREFKGGDPIPFVMEELLKGPSAEEKSKGILNAIPRRLKFDTNYKFENGILHLSFSRDLELGGSPEILKDRIDQITYSLIGNFGVKGISVYIGKTKLRSLGGDGMSLPEILAKNPRKVILF